MYALFSLGRVGGTPAAIDVLKQAGKSHQEILDAHAFQTPGMISDLQITLNKQAIEAGDRVTSDFTLTGNEVVRVATVHDRSYTTIMLPIED